MPTETDDSQQRPTKLILWDVDHTLIETRGSGRELFSKAFQTVTGRPMATMAPLAGRTEPDIMSETLELHGIEPTPAVLEDLFEALAAAYEDNVDILKTRGRALPGAHEALTALSDRDDLVTTVLTGNLRRVAAVKLRAFGLDSLLDLAVGAYGSDDAVRSNLVRIARHRAMSKYNVTFKPAMTTLIGDTPNDVTAGLSSGTHVLGVATGKNTTDELASAGAHEVLPDLTDVADLLRKLSPPAPVEG